MNAGLTDSRRRSHVVVAVAIATLCVACHAGSPPAGERGMALIIAQRQEPVSLNPLYLEGPIASAVDELSYSYLTDYDSDGHLVPGITREVPSLRNGGVSRDGRRVIYRLRHDVRWQDGTPLTSRDVEFTYHAIMNPANTIPSQFGYDEIASVNARDPYTVVVTLKRPYSPILSQFFGADNNYAILPAHLLARYQDLDRVAFGSDPVGSGPYAVETWARGDHITWRAHGGYYAGRPAIKRITLRFIHDVSTIVTQLLTHEIDAAFYVDVSQITRLRGLADHRIAVTPVPYFYSLDFNMTDPLIRDPFVRRAFALAIDRRSIVRKVTYGLYDADNGPRGLFTWAYDPHANNIPYNPQGAMELLRKDHWAPNADGIREKNGKRLEIQLAFYTGSDVETKFATEIAAQERAVGIDVSTKPYSREQITAIDGPVTQGRFQVELYDFQADYDPDASWLLACSQQSPHGFNDARYCNHAVDNALMEGQASFERRIRIRAYRFVQRQIAADLPYYFLCQVSEVDVIPTQLEGFARPLISPYTSVTQWRLRR